jgi:Ser/Thr protein kinase RdoA (MazF antagonist)
LCELELLNFLSKKNFPCPRPVGPILKIVNKYVCCFEFIEGREPSRITDVVLKRAGELMARFHKLTEKFNTGYKREGEGLEVIKKYIKNKKRIILASRFKDAGNFITYLETEISKILFSKNLPFGVVHIDVKKENLIAGRDEKLYFIDFDNFYFDSLVMDIANAVMWLCERGEKLDVRKAKIFLRAYDKIRKITALERENLKEAMKLYCLKGMFKYAYICLPRLKFAEKWAYHFVRTYKNISKQKINF